MIIRYPSFTKTFTARHLPVRTPAVRAGTSILTEKAWRTTSLRKVLLAEN